MPVEQYSLVANDWLNLEFIINDLTQRVVGQELHPTSAPTFADLTLTGDLNITGDLDIGGTLTLDVLTASRLVATNASKGLESSDLFGWVAGTAKRVTVADDADGTITLSGPQDIDTVDSPTFAGLTITNAAVISSNSVVFQPNTDSTTFLQVLDADGGTPILNVDSTNERIGIGTNAPDSIFHIKANTPGTVGSHPAGQLIIQDPDDTVFGNAVITGYESDANGNPDQQLWYLGSSSSSNSEIIYLNRRNSKLHLGTNGIVRMTIESGSGNGYVGIGTTSPKTKLTVEGTLTLKEQAAADGDTAAYGQVWCKDDVPNTLWFVNDLGTELRIAPQDLQTSASPTFAGLTIVNAINEFSTDGTMGGDSDSAVPTEKATKLYTDTLRSDLASVANAKGASLVGIEDSATYFDATDVEAALSELMVLVTPVEYNPAMTRTAGGDAGGNDASVATIDDADSYDTDELSATPGFDIQAVFSGVADFNQVQIHTAYDGNPAHVVRIDLDKTPFDWSNYDTILADIDDNSGNFIFNAITVASAAQYINSGEVRLRFYHSSAGNATHDFFIDYCALWKTGVSVGVTEHGGLTGLDDVSDHPSYLLLDGSRALAGAWDMGNQALTNVNIDSGVITGITDLTIADGGTGQSTAQLAINALSAVSGATNEHVLTKDTGTGNAIWKASGAGAHTHDGDTLQLDGINSDGGAFAFTTSGAVTFSQNVGIGITPSVPLHISDGNAVNAALITSVYGLISAYNVAPGFSIVSAGPDSTDRAVFQGIRSNGTLASPTVPAINDFVLSILGSIYDGTDTEGTAAIDFIVDGNVSSNVAPQRVSICTSETNSASRLERLTVKNTGCVGINTTSIPHAGIGSARLAIDGPASSAGITHATTGPHVQFTTHGDNYPVLQLLNYAHDNINLNFDSYFDTANGWISSDTGSCFSIAKTSDTLRFRWDVAAQGAAVTWNDGIIMNNAGAVQINGVFESVGVATLADGSTLKTSAAPTADAEIPNKKYVDDNVGGANHAILDGSVHTDSVADAVTRGSIIYGNATPKWDELGLGLVNTFLGSDGTDLSYRTAAQVMASLSGAGTAAFDLNGQDLTNGGVLFLTEQAAAEGDTAGKGQWWVKNDSPCSPYFTDDTGIDIPLDNRMVDRGDPANWDWTEATLTTDETWVNLDLSGIVPVNTKFVWFTGYLRDDAVESYFQIRREGNSNTRTAFTTSTRVANIVEYFTSLGPVPVDANRVVEYRTSNTTFTDIKVAVSTWVLG